MAGRVSFLRTWLAHSEHDVRKFEKAAAVFGQVGTPQGLFNRGNALLFHGQYDGAIATYKAVIKQRPEWKAPKVNLSVAEARKKALAPPDDAVAREKLTKDDAPDDIVFDDRAKNNPNAAEDEVAEGAGLDDVAGAGVLVDGSRRFEPGLHEVADAGCERRVVHQHQIQTAPIAEDRVLAVVAGVAVAFLASFIMFFQVASLGSCRPLDIHVRNSNRVRRTHSLHMRSRAA